ncbi:alpha/beta hydrolase-fold protein [Pontimicrobium sp. SW4]|uniref:Alpha/beta hydrolase-fold protein n=1 Tax=Pontimicrobium sp. SW4 TaxID=3153519 RepID=A0AAU7BUQ4_9FLAO
MSKFHIITIYRLAIFYFLTINNYTFGQSLVTIPSTNELTLTSSINKIEYNLLIALPFDYENSTKEYPVIYLLDANDDFSLLTSIYRRLQSPNEFKEYVIVGISYKHYPKYHRRVDYTPSKDVKAEKSGGAQKFVNILSDEVFPTIENKYRVKESSRTLFGHSLGGLFCSYLLTNNSSLFDNYVVSSPSVWWDNYFILKNLNSSFSKKAIFLSVGSNETPMMHESYNKLSKFINNNLLTSSKKAITLNGESHASAKIRAYTDGLRWLFKNSL